VGAVAGQQSSRAAEQQSSRAAEQQSSRAGHRGSIFGRPFFAAIHHTQKLDELNLLTN